MQVGLFVEGRSDAAVLTNILKGALNIDRSDIRYEVPEFEYDETDLHTMQREGFSNWTIVKKACIEKDKIADFFYNPIEQSSFVVIQIDTAERHLAGYDVLHPEKASVAHPEYSRQLRNNVIGKINSWLDHSFANQIAYAVTIEEIEAWVLTLYSDIGDTAKYPNPKKTLSDVLGKKLASKDKKMLKAKAFDKYHFLSEGFRKKKKLQGYAAKNESLKLFYESLEKFAIA